MNHAFLFWAAFVIGSVAIMRTIILLPQSPMSKTERTIAAVLFLLGVIYVVLHWNPKTERQKQQLRIEQWENRYIQEHHVPQHE